MLLSFLVKQDRQNVFQKQMTFKYHQISAPRAAGLPLSALLVGGWVTFQTEMLEDSLHVCIQLWLCMSALGDVGPRHGTLSKPRQQKKSFCSVKKKRELAYF